MQTKTQPSTVGRRWRRLQLVEAGFERALADRLSRDPRYDLHALIELASAAARPRSPSRSSLHSTRSAA